MKVAQFWDWDWCASLQCLLLLRTRRLLVTQGKQTNGQKTVPFPSTCQPWWEAKDSHSETSVRVVLPEEGQAPSSGSALGHPPLGPGQWWLSPNSCEVNQFFCCKKFHGTGTNTGGLHFQLPWIWRLCLDFYFCLCQGLRYIFIYFLDFLIISIKYCTNSAKLWIGGYWLKSKLPYSIQYTKCMSVFMKETWQKQTKKSRIRETKQLSTNADSSTDSIGGWTKNTPKLDFVEKWKKSSKTQKLKNV